MNARLRDELPSVRGTYQEHAPLRDFLWFRAGGPAEILFRPADADDLQNFLANKPPALPVTVIGVGSNLLVRDGGIRGVVVRLPASFGRCTVEGNRVRAGRRPLMPMSRARRRMPGVGGLEFLRGIPGTIGGALRMNAGCYGREIKDVFVEAIALDPARASASGCVPMILLSPIGIPMHLRIRSSLRPYCRASVNRVMKCARGWTRWWRNADRRSPCGRKPAALPSRIRPGRKPGN